MPALPVEPRDPAAAYLVGRLVDEAGDPVARAMLHVQVPGDRMPRDYEESGRDGSFRFGPLPPAPAYHVHVEPKLLLEADIDVAARRPGNLNVRFDGIDGEALLVSLDDIAVSSGAACTAAEPSHVLVALGLSKDRALASLRFGIGRTTTTDEVDYAAAKVSDVVAKLRQMSPV